MSAYREAAVLVLTLALAGARPKASIGFYRLPHVLAMGCALEGGTRDN